MRREHAAGATVSTAASHYKICQDRSVQGVARTGAAMYSRCTNNGSEGKTAVQTMLAFDCRQRAAEEERRCGGAPEGGELHQPVADDAEPRDHEHLPRAARAAVSRLRPHAPPPGHPDSPNLMP